jgi:hypothetical protein
MPTLFPFGQFVFDPRREIGYSIYDSLAKSVLQLLNGGLESNNDFLKPGELTNRQKEARTK